MHKYYIWTIGCQMNKAESQRIIEYLGLYGYHSTDTPQNADLIILNTCIVRQSAEDKVIGTLGLLKRIKRDNPLSSILVTGCFVDSKTGDLERRFPHVDLFFKPGDYHELLNWFQKGKIVLSNATRNLTSRKRMAPTALVPIIQGCDNFCSYCVVPYRRGREKSRPMIEIIHEVMDLAKNGVKEITLLGQNVNSYGHDLLLRPDLSDLLTDLSYIDGLARIRFLTNHPKDMSHKLIKNIASLDKVCEHINLPVQSGDNAILKAMRRDYTIQQYRDLIGTIRSHIPEIALSTDVIVGFPGETYEQFKRTEDLLEEIKFDTVHVAAYSPRPDTIASRENEDSVPSVVKKERLDSIERLHTEIAGEINSRLQGKTVEILVEGKKKEKWFGRTRSNKLVFFDNKGDYLGQLVTITVNKTSPWALQGQITIDDPYEESMKDNYIYS